VCNAAALGDDREPLDEDCPEAATAEAVGDLDCNFCVCLIELDVDGVTDERRRLVNCD
jgi:hypothetical protein